MYDPPDDNSAKHILEALGVTKANLENHVGKRVAVNDE